MLWRWITGSTAATIWALGPVVPAGVSVGTGVAMWRRWTGDRPHLSRQLDIKLEYQLTM